jgi:phage shock protein A
MFSRFMSLMKAFAGRLMGRFEDPEMMLEQTYQEAQSNLIQVRQAVAQAIATEKQLEQQLQKNKDQAATWQNRAAMAVQQSNDDLARQALQRKQQYAQAAGDLEGQLKQQKDATQTLRGRLTELEGEVQKLYTKKQVLIARDKAATATTRANQIISKTTTNGALSIVERMEQKVSEKESKAAALAELGTDTLDHKFKSFEGSVDIEAELMALKGGSTGGGSSPKLIVEKSEKEPVMAESSSGDSIEAEDVRELDKD